jgi:hypothetical protein
MAEFKTIFWYLFIIIVSVLGIASSGISLQCYTDNPSYNPYGDEKLRNSNFLYTIINLTLLVVLFIGGITSLISGSQ